MTPSLRERTDQFEEARIDTEAIWQEDVQHVFAGSLFVVLNNLLWSMALRVQKRGGGEVPLEAGRRIGRTSLFQLIRAASNNFRHYEEWHGAIKNNRPMARNVAVLKAAGLKRPWNRNLCYDVLEIIGWKNQSQLPDELRQLASEIFQAQTGLPL